MAVEQKGILSRSLRRLVSQLGRLGPQYDSLLLNPTVSPVAEIADALPKAKAGVSVTALVSQAVPGTGVNVLEIATDGFYIITFSVVTLKSNPAPNDGSSFSARIRDDQDSMYWAAMSAIGHPITSPVLWLEDAYDCGIYNEFPWVASEYNTVISALRLFNEDNETLQE